MSKISSKITLGQLAAFGVPAGQLEKFRELFGNSTDVEIMVLKYWRDFTWYWLARRLLSPPNHAAYEKERLLKRQEFEHMCSSVNARFCKDCVLPWIGAVGARAKQGKRIVSAMNSYERACAFAFARAYIKQCNKEQI